MRGGARRGGSAPRRSVELGALAGLVALALAVRGPGLAGFAPTHWDEGLVWSGARWFATVGAEGHYSPTQGPPGVPALLALTRLAGGGPGAAVWTSVAAGCLAVVLVARVGRRLGPGPGPAPATGLAAAALLAASGFQAMYARSLLAEPVLLCAVLATLLAALRYLERPDGSRLAVVAACVVLAQYTKYNGALAGAPLGVLLLVRAARASAPAERRRALGHAALLLAAVLGAVAVNLLAIARMGDLDYFREHDTGYVGVGAAPREAAAWLVRTTPAGVLLLAGIGAVAGLRERRGGAAGTPGGVPAGGAPGARWALVLGALALYALFLARYTFYLRLLVPVAGLAVLPAGRGLVALARLRPRRAGVAAAALAAGLVVADTVRTWPRFRVAGWGGYARATAALRAVAADGAPVLSLAQRHVWPDDAPPRVYGGPGLPNAAATRLLARRGEGDVVLVVDVHAFSKHGPRSVAPRFDTLWAAYGVERVDNPLGLDVLENNLSPAEIARLATDPAARERWLSIHVLRAPAADLARRLAAPAPGGR